jgi:hypothetical protein
MNNRIKNKRAKLGPKEKAVKATLAPKKQKLEKYTAEDIELVLQTLPNLSKPVHRNNWDGKVYTVGFKDVNHIRECNRRNNTLGKQGLDAYVNRVNAIYQKTLEAKREVTTLP